MCDWLFILNFSFWWTKPVSFNIVQSIDLLCLVYSVCCVGSICLLQIYDHISVWHCLKDFLTSHFDLQSTQNSCLCMVWSVGPDYSFSIWIPNWPALFKREAFATAMCNDLCPKSRVYVCIGLFLDCLLYPLVFFSPSLCQYTEKAMAPHSSTLAWKIPWTEEPGRLQSMGSLRIRHDWATSLSRFNFHASEKEMATQSSVLAWRIPGTGSLVGRHLWGHTESDTTDATQQQQQNGEN